MGISFEGKVCPSFLLHSFPSLQADSSEQPVMIAQGFQEHGQIVKFQPPANEPEFICALKYVSWKHMTTALVIATNIRQNFSCEYPFQCSLSRYTHFMCAQAFVMALCTTWGGVVHLTPSGRAFSPSSLRLTFPFAFPHLPVSWVPNWNIHQFSGKLTQNGAAYWKNTTQRDFFLHGCFFCLQKRPSPGALLVLLGRQDFHLISWKNAASVKISIMMNNTTKTTSPHIF